MNEQLQQALTAILNKTMSGVDAGVNFLSAEIPDVIHQLLMWEMAQAGIGLFLILLVFTASVFATKKGLKVLARYNEGTDLYLNNHGNDDEKRGKAIRAEADRKMPLAIISFIICAISSVLLVIVGTSSLMTLVKIWIAPKIYLIEYAASLAK